MFRSAGNWSPRIASDIDGLLCLCVVGDCHDVGQREFVGWNPVRWVIFGYLAAQVLSWVIAASRASNVGVFPAPDMALLMRLGLGGIALLAMDGIRTREEANRLIDHLIMCAMIMVVAGLIQFFFTYDLVPWLRIPGLQLNNDAVLLINNRSNFNRPSGTGLHAIEFGVVSASLIPPAYLYAQRRKRLVRPPGRISLAALPVVILAFAAMTSFSRSAMLAAAVALIGLLLSVTWRAARKHRSRVGRARADSRRASQWVGRDAP